MRTKNLKQRLYHRVLIERYVRRSLRECAAVTAVSGQLAKTLEEHTGHHATVIPNWVDTSRFCPAQKVKRSVVESFRLLYAGTARLHKGFDAVQRLASTLPSGIEILCRESLKESFDRDGSTRVRFYKDVMPERMVDLYAQCDAVLVPSRYEGFGYVALEAMACGLPVVGFDIAAMREVCGTDGEAASLVPLDDVERLGAAVIALRQDSTRAKRMGEAGRQRAIERFPESRSIEQYVQLYGELLAKS